MNPDRLEPIDRLVGRTTATLDDAAAAAAVLRHRDPDAAHVPARPAPAAPGASAAEQHRAAMARVEHSRQALRDALIRPRRHADGSGGVGGAGIASTLGSAARGFASAAASSAMHRFAPSAAGGVYTGGVAGGGILGVLRRMTRGLRGGHFATVAGTAVGFIRGWWRAQPWHTTGEVAALALRTELTPLARRHPWAALGGAALLGALLVKLKPWRWAPVVATTRPLVGVATRWSVAQITSPAVQLAAAAVLSAWVSKRMEIHEQRAGADPTPVRDEVDPDAVVAAVRQRFDDASVSMATGAPGSVRDDLSTVERAAQRAARRAAEGMV